MKRVLPRPFPAEPWVREAADLGQAIRAARTSTGLTAESAALSLGIARTTLLDLEKGAPTVSLGTALRVAAELGVTVFITEAVHRERVRRLIDEARR